MKKPVRCIAAVLLSCTPVIAAAQAVNADAKVLADFQERVKKYVELQKDASKGLPVTKETAEPAKIKASQDALAARIRAARTNARRGDIFTPEIADAFRRLMYPETKGPQGAETKAALKEDAPKPNAVPLKVNARYPDAEPLPTMPPNLLANLPKLPENLEYRIVGHDLILRDVRANLIVDFIPKAIR
jgi:hypothetical protein